MLYLLLLTFLSLFITATLAALPINLHEKADFVKNHPLSKFHANIPSSSKRPIASSEGNTFVLSNAFANNECNGDGGQLDESVAFLSGFCQVSDIKTAQRWTCDSSTVHIEQFNAGDCDENHRTLDSYINIGQCFPSNSTQPIYAVSYDCSSNYVPKGSWLSSLSYTDKACKNPVQAVSILNGFCLLGYNPNTSYKYDYPKENYYLSSADCTGAVTSYDISASTNVCYSPSTAVGSISSYQTLFVEN